ncbi:MAG: hypothetical protein K8S99_04155 [Planctomycetes bacterium]|nr:hypothetical protein [Planctomycetota bacterium]
MDKTTRHAQAVMLLSLILLGAVIGSVVIGLLIRAWRRYNERLTTSRKNEPPADAWTIAGQRLETPPDDTEENEDDETDPPPYQ